LESVQFVPVRRGSISWAARRLETPKPQSLGPSKRRPPVDEHHCRRDAERHRRLERRQRENLTREQSTAPEIWTAATESAAGSGSQDAPTIRICPPASTSDSFARLAA